MIVGETKTVQRPLLQTAVSRLENAAGAVRAGADEILLRMPVLPEGNGPDKTWLEAAEQVIGYCRLRGVKTVLDLRYPHTDRNLMISAEVLRALYRAGLDAAVPGDLGVLRMTRMEAPDLALHWAYAADPDGLDLARGAGCVRALLPPTMPQEEAAGLAARRGSLTLQYDIWTPGCPAWCLSECYLDPYCRRTGDENAACRKPYGYTGKADRQPLAAESRSRLRQFRAWIEAGVTVLGMDTPAGSLEETAALTGFAVSVLRRKTPETAKEKEEMPPVTPQLLERLRSEIAQMPEAQRVPVRFLFQAEPGQSCRLAADDYQGHTVYVTGPVPEIVSGDGTLEAEYNTRLYQCGGTPYRCEEARSRVTKGFSVDWETFGNMKTALLEKMSAARSRIPERKSGKYQPGVRILPRREAPQINLMLRSIRQLSHELLALRPGCLYLPLETLEEAPERVKTALASGIRVAAVLPRMVPETQRGVLEKHMAAARNLGVEEGLARHSSQLALLARAGLSARAGFGVRNSQELKALRHLGVLSASLSMSLPLKTVREMSHVLDTELVVYGRMPLLFTETCLIRQEGGLCNCENRRELTDEKGAPHPLVRDCGHSSLLLDAAKLWLLPERSRWRRAGLWGVLLHFTTENARECIQVTERFMGLGQYEPNQRTTGFYLRNDRR